MLDVQDAEHMLDGQDSPVSYPTIHHRRVGRIREVAGDAMFFPSLIVPFGITPTYASSIAGTRDERCTL